LWPGVLGAGAVAAAMVAVIGGLQVLGSESDLVRLCEEGNPLCERPGGVNTVCEGDGPRLAECSTGERGAAMTFVGWPVAGVLGAAAIALFFVESSRSEPPAIEATIAPTADGGAFSASLRF
jgi:hypothetical protein